MLYRQTVSSVRLALAIENPVFRSDIQRMLVEDGFAGQVYEAQTAEAAVTLLREKSFDLLILQAEIGGSYLAPMVRDLRNGQLFSHPFPLVVMLSSGREMAYLHDLIDCGPDDVLLMPVQRAKLQERVRSLSKRRKRFVVTQGYVGPDRRSTPRAGGADSGPLLDVPNPLEGKAAGRDPMLLQRDIEEAAQQLDRLRVERHGAQILWLEKHLHHLLASHQPETQMIASHSRRLVEIAQDLKARTRSWPHGRIARAAEALHHAAEIMSEGACRPAKATFATLSMACRQTCQEIVMGLPSEEIQQVAM